MILSIMNNRHQSGKTFSAMNIATHLALHKKKKVLFIDLDPQATATIEFKRKSIYSAYDILKKKKSIGDIVQTTEFENLYLMPSSINLTYIEKEFYKNPNQKQFLGELISYLKNKFDFVIIDLPPYFGVLTTIALIHSDSILIPLKSDSKILGGIFDVVKMIKVVQESANRNLSILGFLPTFFDTNNKESLDSLNALIEKFENFIVKKEDEIILIPKYSYEKLILSSAKNEYYLNLVEILENKKISQNKETKQ
jgi:chromosome partitioning protein